MAMMQMFVSEWQAFAGTVHASQAGSTKSMTGGRGARAADSARLQRKWVRKQIGLAIAAAGTMIIFLHGMVQLTA
ncbi:hypothetical protein [Ralstonia soli]|uniref:Transmembrane protein n=1 Tax=Ralstonia soli TaxID=2953896 RepID=A0ABT1AP42_9RALS|nr:hypothetical protein [Ralstonia soli]MCO5400051.1 hypothetical protein [Ralstonia soli]